MRMEATAISCVFEGDLRAKGDLERVTRKIVALEVRLEQGGHLRVARAGVVENEEVELEGGHIDKQREENEA